MVDIIVQGIPCVFNDKALDDFDMLEKLDDMGNGNVTAMVGFARGIFGSEQLDNIKSQLRGDDGICRLEDMAAFINASIVEASKARKAEPKN